MVSQASKLLDDAREQAIADARRKAEIYAKAAGVTLGAPLSITEEGAPGPMPFRKMAGGMAAARRWRKAKRRCGDGERVLGDQAEAVACTQTHRHGAIGVVSKDESARGSGRRMALA